MTRNLEMAGHTMKYGILVAVDGSAESDAAVRWLPSAAVMHDSLVTLVRVVVPVVTSWPVRSLQAEFNAWQEDNARQVLDQAEKIVHASGSASELPDIRTGTMHDYVSARPG